MVQVRPFTLGQLKELLSRTGTLVEEGFWIDKIKSHCYVTVSSRARSVGVGLSMNSRREPSSVTHGGFFSLFSTAARRRPSAHEQLSMALNGLRATPRCSELTSVSRMR